MRNSSKKQN